MLDANNRPVSIERIHRDENLIADMFSALTDFWKRVVAPNIFETSVPRDLSPFVLPDFFDGLTFPACDIVPTAATKDGVPGSKQRPATSSDRAYCASVST